MSTLPFVPSRGCLGCPNRGTCHSARQRQQDAVVPAGRHYTCEFYRSIQATKAAKAAGSFWRFLPSRMWGDA